uniref:Periplasmic heavy metal sensor n=1 Tax=Desulfobacca acetoxidans TaxID=60893 RepID=A0A7C5EPE6_9BACT
MTRRLSMAVMLILLLSLSLAATAWAGPWGMGPRGANLTPQQAEQLFQLRQQFFNQTADLRQQMAVTRAELAELWAAKEPDQAKISAKQKELLTLQEQLLAKSNAFRLKAQKIAPQMAGPWGPYKGKGCWW